MRLRPRRPYDPATLDLLEEAGRIVERAALLVRELFADYPERQDLAQELYRCEQEGDRVAHDLIHRLNGGRPSRLRVPFAPADGHILATTLDDIVDFAEEA